MKREIIRIDEDLCDGCGECVPACAEGALQIIDGKAKLMKDTLCDGLGACLGDCHTGALTIESREADDFDEEEVERHLGSEPASRPVAVEMGTSAPAPHQGGCPGSRTMTFEAPQADADEKGSRPSQLQQWPVQLHLLSPTAPYFKGADTLLCADCVPFAMADFHKDFLKGRALAIACPKLDTNQEVYLGKLVSMIDDARINTLTVMIMLVPCCGGLLQLAAEAVTRAKRKVPVKKIVVGMRGEVLAEEWVELQAQRAG